MKIDDLVTIPQIIFNEYLALNYSQFMLLLDLNLIDKIISNKICCHFRFFKNQIAYPKINFSKRDDFLLKNDCLNFFNFLKIHNNECIYCISNKKQLKKVQFFCNFRNSLDEETHQILDFCESNQIIINLYDSDNHNSFYNQLNNDIENSKEFYLKNSRNRGDKLLLIDDQIVKIEDFFNKISFEENYNFKAEDRCFICNRLLLFKFELKNLEVDRKLVKCELCLKKFKENSNLKIDFNDQDIKNECCFGKNNFKIFKEKINNKKGTGYYNFIEKLRLKEFYNENPEKSFFENKEIIFDSNKSDKIQI